MNRVLNKFWNFLFELALKRKQKQHYLSSVYGRNSGYQLHGMSNDELLYQLKTYPGYLDYYQVSNIVFHFNQKNIDLNKLILFNCIEAEQLMIHVIRGLNKLKKPPVKKSLDFILSMLRFDEYTLREGDYKHLFDFISMFQGENENRDINVGLHSLVRLLKKDQLTLDAHNALTSYLCERSAKKKLPESLQSTIWTEIEISITKLKGKMSVEWKEKYIRILDEYSIYFSEKIFAIMGTSI